MRKSMTLCCSSYYEVDGCIENSLSQVSGDLIDYRVVPVDTRSLIVTIVYEDHSDVPPIRNKIMG